MKKFFKKENRGITLIALIITLIILLILAGISISALTGSELFGKAENAIKLSELKQIEESARISYMERQIDELDGGERVAIQGVINDLREKGYAIKEVTGGTNSVTGVKLDKSEISMEKNATETIAYQYEYASGTTVRYFAEVQGKNYEIIFNNGEITVSTVETDLTAIDKLPEVTVATSNDEIVEAEKAEEGKILLTSKEKGGEVTITVTCAGKPVTCKVIIELFTGLDKDNTNPVGALPNCPIEVIEADSSKGIVIETTNGDKTIQWVWVEVPKKEFTTVSALKEEKVEEEITEEELNSAIKADLIRYAGVYRKGSASQNLNYTDTWYNGCGVVDATAYNAMYSKMINSVYKNGGFWIQRYEDGTVNIICANAQIKASGYAPDETKTSSLLFGIQWDLVCKYLEVSYNWSTPPSGKTNAYYLNENSSTWGKYSSSSVQSGLDRNKRMNIYDFAGNLVEWTLEYGSNPCVGRGGYYGDNSSDVPASYRTISYTTSLISNYVSFRATFY